jgi:hypothetical protein
MKSINRLLVLTIFFNIFILVGAGHGIGFLGLIEVIGFREIFRGETQFSLIGNYDDRLFTSALLSTLGQLMLFVAYFRSGLRIKFKIIYTGLFVLFISFFVLTNDLFNSDLDNFSFWTGLPFLITAVWLLIRTIKDNRLTSKVQQPTGSLA